MPHLSPMNWIMAISFFWTYLFLISIRKWWNRMPLPPKLYSSMAPNKTKWYWL